MVRGPQFAPPPHLWVKPDVLKESLYLHCVQVCHCGDWMSLQSLSANPPDVAVVNVEGQTQDAKQDSEAGEDGNGCKQLLGQEAVFLGHHGTICWRFGT